MNNQQKFIVAAITCAAVIANAIVRHIFWGDINSQEPPVANSEETESYDEYFEEFNALKFNPETDEKPSDSTRETSRSSELLKKELTPVISNVKPQETVEENLEIHPVSSDPVYYYSFEGNTIDSINQVSGTITSAGLHAVDGIMGRAYSFSDYTHYIQLPVKRLNVQQGSVSLWFFVNGWDPHSSYLLFHRENERQTYYQDRCRIEIYLSNQQLCLGMSDSHEFMENIAPIDLKTWYNVTLTWQSGKCSIYLDGKPLKSGNYKKFTRKRKTSHRYRRPVRKL